MATQKKSKTTAIANWDEQLAKQAQIAAAAEESTATGQFFSIKSGVLSFGGSPIPGNQMAVVVLDSIFETVYYEGDYDPDSPQGPKAFALGRDEKTLTWHENSAPEFAGQLCSESEVCEWGSAPKGRGKAARETRRIAMIPAGTINEGKFKQFTSEEQFTDSQIAYMKLPVTSVKGYATFVKQLAGALRRPPHGVFTRVSVVPDPSTQFKVVFEPLGQVPNELMSVIMARHQEAVDSIEFPYGKYEEVVQPTKKLGKRTPAKTKRY